MTDLRDIGTVVLREAHDWRSAGRSSRSQDYNDGDKDSTSRNFIRGIPLFLKFCRDRLTDGIAGLGRLPSIFSLASRELALELLSDRSREFPAPRSAAPRRERRGA